MNTHIVSVCVCVEGDAFSVYYKISAVWFLTSCFDISCRHSPGVIQLCHTHTHTHTRCCNPPPDVSGLTSVLSSSVLHLPPAHPHRSDRRRRPHLLPEVCGEWCHFLSSLSPRVTKRCRVILTEGMRRFGSHLFVMHLTCDALTPSVCHNTHHEQQNVPRRERHKHEADSVRRERRRPRGRVCVRRRHVVMWQQQTGAGGMAAPSAASPETFHWQEERQRVWDHLKELRDTSSVFYSFYWHHLLDVWHHYQHVTNTAAHLDQRQDAVAPF